MGGRPVVRPVGERVGQVLLGGHRTGQIVRVDVAAPVPERRGPRIVTVAQVRRDRPIPPALTSASAEPIPITTAFDFGASAAWMVAWARMIPPSGIPIIATAWAAATAVCRALGSAMPMSSLARITSLRAMKRGSSPASIMRAR